MSFRSPFLVLSGFLVLVAPALSQAQLTPEEKKGLNEALYVGNLQPRDLTFDKKVTADPLRTKLAAFALDDPMGAADSLLALHQVGKLGLPKILSSGNSALYGDSEPEPSETTILGPLPEGVPDRLAEVVEVLLGGIDEATQQIHKALSELSPAEQREVIEGLPELCAGSKSVHFSFAKGKAVDEQRIFALLSKVDLPTIRAASERLTRTVQNQRAVLRNLSKSVTLAHSLRFTVHGYRVEITSDAHAEHTSRDTNLLISFGDRNRFTGRFGAGIGYASVLLDFGKGSYYDVPDLSIGAGLLGIGVAFVEGSGDVFRGKSLCFGSGVAGVGALCHTGDEPTYQAIALAEGFGAFGAGVLVENGAKASFDVQLYGQGAARTQGLGWLISRGSDATLTAGGLVPTDARGDTLSASQGFSSGFGFDDQIVSGGVGLVSSFGTNASYLGGVQCQAAAVLGGLGSIFDEGVGGSHLAVQECQSYADHQASSYLFNLGGANSYTCKLNSAQACSSDFSVSVVLDRAGHDLYASRDSSPATAMDNGLSLFINSGDETRFVGEPGLAVSSGPTSSLGIFCDIGAGTRFTSESGLAPIKVDNNVSVFYQSPALIGLLPAMAHREQHFVPGTEPNPGEAQIAILWNQARKSGPDALAARRRLISIGAPSAAYIYKTELDGWNPIDAPALAQVVSGIGLAARKLLSAEMEGNNLTHQSNALRLACLSPGDGMDASIEKALLDPYHQRLAARAAGVCMCKGLVKPLIELAKSKDPHLALLALVSLAQIGDPAAAGVATGLLQSNQWPIRRAASALLAKFPAETIQAAAALMASGNEQTQRTGVQLLAQMDTDEGYRRVGHLLSSSNPAIALQALLSLQGHVPPELRGQVTALQTGSNPLLKRIAEGIQAD